MNYVPDAFTGSAAEKTEMVIKGNGNLKVTMNNKFNDGSDTLIELPSGTQSQVSHSAAVFATAPSSQTEDGREVKVHTALNFDGETEIRVEILSEDGSAEQFLLPKVAAGANTQILHEESERRIVAEMPLRQTTQNSTTARMGQTNTLNTTDLSDDLVFLGRDPSDGSILYIQAISDDAKVRIERRFDDSLTRVTLIAGNAQLLKGSEAPSNVTLNEEFLVSNSMITREWAEGSQLINMPLIASLTPADLEIKFQEAHSVWFWQPEDQAWNAYAANPDHASFLVKQDGTSLIQDTLTPLNGVWLHMKEAGKTYIHDDQEERFNGNLNLNNVGWHLVGTSNESGVSFANLVSTQTNAFSVWKLEEGRWKAFTNDSEYRKMIEENVDVDLLDAQTQLFPKEAVWVEIVSGASTTRRSRLIAPPQ